MSPGYKHCGYLSDNSFFTQLEPLYLHVGGIPWRPTGQSEAMRENSQAPDKAKTDPMACVAAK